MSYRKGSNSGVLASNVHLTTDLTTESCKLLISVSSLVILPSWENDHEDGVEVSTGISQHESEIPLGAQSRVLLAAPRPPLTLPDPSTPHAHRIMDFSALFVALTSVLGPNRVHTLQLLNAALKTLLIYTRE